MPTRIKPYYVLKPSRLNRSSIEGICNLVCSNFSKAQFEASDGVWEVYEATSAELLESILSHDKLDRFAVAAEQRSLNSGFATADGLLREVTVVDRSIEIVFDSEQAIVRFVGVDNQGHWLKHFLIDLENYLILQKPQRLRRQVAHFIVSLTGSSRLDFGNRPYTEIILKDKAPNPFMENVKANLLSNVVWLIVGAIVVFIMGWLASWMYLTYRVNIYEWFQPPQFPPVTPGP